LETEQKLYNGSRPEKIAEAAVWLAVSSFEANTSALGKGGRTRSLLSFAYITRKVCKKQKSQDPQLTRNSRVFTFIRKSVPTHPSQALSYLTKVSCKLFHSNNT